MDWYNKANVSKVKLKERGGKVQDESVKRRHVPYSKFKAFMVENGIKQMNMAKLLNKSVSALNQNLNGTGGDFSIAELRIICNRFNISADEFFIAQKVSKKKQRN